MRSGSRKTPRSATVRVPREVWARARKRALAEDRELNEVVTEALKQYASAPERPLGRFLELARRVTSAQRRGRPSPRWTKEELHGSGT